MLAGRALLLAMNGGARNGPSRRIPVVGAAPTRPVAQVWEKATEGDRDQAGRSWRVTMMMAGRSTNLGSSRARRGPSSRPHSLAS